MAGWRALGLALLLSSLGSILCSAEEHEDWGEHFGPSERELSRSKRSPGWGELCPCPGTVRFQKQKHHREGCPCDHGRWSVPERPQPHHHRHPHRGKSKQPPRHGKRRCQSFLQHCRLQQISIPL